MRPATEPVTGRLSRRVRGKHAFAVSPVQEAYLRWAHEESVLPENVPTMFKLEGPLDLKQLAAALNHVVARHDALQSTFHLEGSGFVQVALPQAIDLRVVDLDRDRVARTAREEFHRPFDLSRGPMLRGVVFRLDEHEHLLLITFCHLAIDAWSLKIFFSELADTYARLERDAHVGLAPAPSYSTFAAWERLRQDRGSRYWSDELKGAHFDLRAPPGMNSSGHRRVGFRYRSFGVAAAVIETIGHSASAFGGSQVSTALAVVASALSGAFHQEELVFVIPAHGRVHPDSHTTIGLFYRPMFIRTRPKHELPFSEFVAQVSTTLTRGSLHQVYPVADFRKYMYRSSWFMFDSFPEPSLDLPGIEADTLEVESSEVQFFTFPQDRTDLFAPLDVYLVPSTDGGLEITFAYKGHVLPDGWVDGLIRHTQDLFGRLTHDIHDHIGSLAPRF
jgi:Condensation domain